MIVSKVITEVLSYGFSAISSPLLPTLNNVISLKDKL